MMYKKIVFATVFVVLLVIFAGSASAQLADDQKAATLNEMRNLSMELCKIRTQVDELAAKWQALGYASGGANPFTQADIDAVATYAGLPLADVQAIIAAFGGFRTQMDTWSLQYRKIMP